MKEKFIHIEANGVQYPLCMNLNVLEEIQEEYGSMSKWGDIVENKDGEEPKIKDLKFGFLAMINEGIDIENENSEIKRKFLNEKQVGRIITAIGIKEITEKIKEVSLNSNSTGEEPKNV